MSKLALSWKPIAWGCGMLAAVGLVHGAIWLITVDRLAVLLREQARMLQEQDWHVVLGPAERTGWPRRAGLAIGPTSIASDGLSWRAERVTADTALHWPGMSAGPTSLRPKGQWVRFGSGAGRAIVARDLTIEVTGDGVDLQGTDFELPGIFEIQALRLRFGPGVLTMGALHLRLSGAAGAPGPVINTLALDAVLRPLVALPGNLQTTAAAWHAVGGVMTLSEFTLTAGNARASGKARIWLDTGLQPKLDGVVHVTGYATGLDDLVTAGLLKLQTAVAAKAVLGLLAAPSVDGGTDIPVQIADGILTVAQFPLARLPILEWSAPISGP